MRHERFSRAGGTRPRAEFGRLATPASRVHLAWRVLQRVRKRSAMADYIFTLQAMTKVHPPDKKVLEDVYLSFLPGAKIGVIGFNGSGKSTLLRIMAGQDKSFV